MDQFSFIDTMMPDGVLKRCNYFDSLMYTVFPNSYLIIDVRFIVKSIFVDGGIGATNERIDTS